MVNNNYNSNDIILSDIPRQNTEGTIFEPVQGTGPERVQLPVIEYCPYTIPRTYAVKLIQSMMKPEKAGYEKRYAEAISILSDKRVQVGISQFNTALIIEEMLKRNPAAKVPKLVTRMPGGTNNTPEYDMVNPKVYPQRIQSPTARSLIRYLMQISSKDQEATARAFDEIKNSPGVTRDNEGQYNTADIVQACRNILTRKAAAEGRPLIFPPIEIRDDSRNNVPEAAATPEEPQLQEAPAVDVPEPAAPSTTNQPAADQQQEPPKNKGTLAAIFGDDWDKPTKTEGDTERKDLATFLKSVYPGISDHDIVEIELQCRGPDGRYNSVEIRSKALTCMLKDERAEEVKKAARQIAAGETEDTNPWHQETKQPFEGSEEWDLTDQDAEFNKAFPKAAGSEPWKESKWRTKEGKPTICREMPTAPEDMLNSLSESGNADRFFRSCKGYVMFDTSATPEKNKPYSQWREWNGTAWIKDEMKLRQAAGNVAKSFKVELDYWRDCFTEYDSRPDALHGTKDEIKITVTAMQNHLQRTNSAAGIKNMTVLAQTLPGMNVNFRTEGRSSLLAFKNGIYDEVENKIYYITDRADIERLKYQFPTRYIDREYRPTTNPENLPKLFLQHLNTIYTDNLDDCLSDEEIIERRDQAVKYARRMWGYGLLGGNPERYVVFLIGNTTNGKSITIRYMQKVVGSGEYGIGSIAELCKSNQDNPRPRFAKSISKSFVFMQEVANADDDRKAKSSDGVISSSLVKEISGETVTSSVRGFMQDSEEQQINCLIVAATNHMPVFDTMDSAMLKRIIIIPHDHEFSDEEAKDPTQYMDELMQEADQVFSLMLDELMQYRSNKINGKPGFPPMPEFWKRREIEYLVPPHYIEFIEGKYAPSNGIHDNLDANKVYQEFRDWCHIQNIDVNLHEKTDIDDQGNVDVRAAITKKETSNLKDAFQLLGYKEGHARKGWKGRKLSEEEQLQHQKQKLEREKQREQIYQNRTGNSGNNSTDNGLEQKGLNYEFN